MKTKEGGKMDEIWQEMKNTGRLAGRVVYYFATTESTNSFALALARKAQTATGSLVVAESQSAGRGRLGRSWLSPDGAGLYFSLLLRPELAMADLPKITLAAGLALALAIEGQTGCAPALKWPNDLYLAGKKCGGILTETEGVAGPEATVVVVGIGLNVITPEDAFPGVLGHTATSLLAATGMVFQRGPLLAAIVRELEKAVAGLEQGGFPEILAQWRARDIHRGRTVSWLNSQGQVISGLSLGPDQDGLLRIRDASGRLHVVISGDVSLAPPL